MGLKVVTEKVTKTGRMETVITVMSIETILAFVILIGLGFILGYLTKQDDAYERGYFFGRADGR